MIMKVLEVYKWPRVCFRRIKNIVNGLLANQQASQRSISTPDLLFYLRSFVGGETSPQEGTDTSSFLPQLNWKCQLCWSFYSRQWLWRKGMNTHFMLKRCISFAFVMYWFSHGATSHLYVLYYFYYFLSFFTRLFNWKTIFQLRISVFNCV